MPNKRSPAKPPADVEPGLSPVTTASSAIGDPFTSLRFVVGIADTDSARAVEVIFPVARLVETPRKRETQFTPLIVRRGLNMSTAWYDWWDEARRVTRPPTRLVTVLLLNDEGGEGRRWLFPDSKPLAYSLSPLNALEGSAVIESLELQVGDFQLFRRQ